MHRQALDHFPSVSMYSSIGSRLRPILLFLHFKLIKPIHLPDALSLTSLGCMIPIAGLDVDIRFARGKQRCRGCDSPRQAA